VLRWPGIEVRKKGGRPRIGLLVLRPGLGVPHVHTALDTGGFVRQYAYCSHTKFSRVKSRKGIPARSLPMLDVANVGTKVVKKGVSP
jgi:hypothetical protein